MKAVHSSHKRELKNVFDMHQIMNSVNLGLTFDRTKVFESKPIAPHTEKQIMWCQIGIRKI